MLQISLSEILDEAQGLLVKTFNRNELKQLLFSKMEVNLDEIAPNATGTKDMVFEVLTWMDRHGYVADLIGAAAADRPKIEEWQALLTKISARTEQPASTRPLPQVVPTNQDSIPPIAIVALIRGYGRLRRVLPDGNAKTVQLQALVNQLLALPLEKYDLAERFHLNDSEGERLAAVLNLVRSPDTRYLRWLSERVAVEGPFVGYQAAVALEAAAEKLPQIDLDALTATVECARKWIPVGERDRGRWQKLNEVVAIIARRSSALS